MKRIIGVIVATIAAPLLGAPTANAATPVTLEVWATHPNVSVEWSNSSGGTDNLGAGKLPAKNSQVHPEYPYGMSRHYTSYESIPIPMITMSDESHNSGQRLMCKIRVNGAVSASQQSSGAGSTVICL